MNCNRIARAYRFLEYAAFGGLLQKCRTAFVSELGQVQRALVIGDGDGRFLRELARACPAAQLDSIDASQSMLRLQQQRLPSTRRDCIRLHHGRLPCELPGNEYSLITTHFFLDCLDRQQTAAVIETISDAASADAVWVVSEFCIPASFWKALRARLWIAAMYAFFRFATGLRVRAIPDYAPMLRQRGFRLVASRAYSAGMIRAEMWKRSPQGERVLTR
jgi:ubiquinone/menaquinone biosynthesis C-methylase UbiE